MNGDEAESSVEEEGGARSEAHDRVRECAHTYARGLTLTLTAYVFDSVDGASAAAHSLRAAEGSGGSSGYALVSWDPSSPLPLMEARGASRPDGGLDSSFWWLLLGLTFSVPLLGAALGEAAGPEAGSLGVVGISETFLNRLRDEVTPGRSTLFLSGGSGEQPIVGVLGREQEVHLVLTASPTARQENALLRVFGVRTRSVIRADGPLGAGEHAHSANAPG